MKISRARPGRRPGRRPGVRAATLGLAAVVLAAVVVAVSLSADTAHESRATLPTAAPTTPTTPATQTPSAARARALMGTPRSTEQWHSGIWAGGATASAQRVAAFGQWRGEPADAVTTYPAYATWDELRGSSWHITTFASFPGTLIYGLPMLPSREGGSFATIIAGRHDDVYRTVATDLVDNGRGRSVVRIGWEANGDWFPWSATAAQAPQYRAAFRHIAQVLHEIAPELIIDFDVGCGTSLRGQHDRLDALTLLYPGDDVVDLVGCDTYDWYNTTSRNEAGWQRTMHPARSVGIGDVAAFARAHGKGMSVPEWGLASRPAHGAGDNPYFITRMREFFEANTDVLVFESYFSEPDTDLANSIFDPVQQPRSSAEYARLW